MEGISIYLAITFVTLVEAGNNYIKDKQFQKMVQIYRQETISAFRGRDGYSTTFLVDQLVVGDVILLNAGMRIPADCILIESFDMICDETLFIDKSLNYGRKRLVPKKALTDNNFEENPNPFLFN